MSLTNLLTIRNTIQADSALSAWMLARYDKQPRHFVGYRKPASAADYPAICYVPIRDKRGKIPDKSSIISLVICINEKNITDDIFDGVAKTDEAAQLIVDSLLGDGSPIWVENGVITVTTDMGFRHPFYETELQFTVLG